MYTIRQQAEETVLASLETFITQRAPEIAADISHKNVYRILLRTLQFTAETGL